MGKIKIETSSKLYAISQFYKNRDIIDTKSIDDFVEFLLEMEVFYRYKFGAFRSKTFEERFAK